MAGSGLIRFVSALVPAVMLAMVVVRLWAPTTEQPQLRPETPAAPDAAVPHDERAAVVVLPPPPRRPAPAQSVPTPQEPAPAPTQILQAAVPAPPAVEPLRPAAPIPTPAPPAPTPLTPTPVAPLPEPAVAPLRPEPPKPVAEPVTAPTRVELPVRAAPPVAAPAPPATPAAATPAKEAATVAEGRALLRILERGAGPQIEIAWPAGAAPREALYQSLRSCFGMELALMDGEGRLYRASGAPAPWQIDLDRYSGFVRDIGATATRQELAEAATANRLHGNPAAAHPVRIFPRRVDALVLGNLRNLIGAGYDAARTIHASYRQQGNRIVLAGIVVDGGAVAGEIDLTGAQSCGR